MLIEPTWLPTNPYPEKISNDADSTMVSNPRYNYWQEGMMVTAGHIFTRGNEYCPHEVTLDFKRECPICWGELLKEMGIKDG